jgi:hypothetical protein
MSLQNKLDRLERAAHNVGTVEVPADPQVRRRRLLLLTAKAKLLARGCVDDANRVWQMADGELLGIVGARSLDEFAAALAAAGRPYLDRLRQAPPPH